MIVEYENVVYISHPYGGKKENEEKVEALINKFQEKHPSYLFVSPIHSFSFMYHTADYQKGLDMCLWLLEKCDEMWVCGDYKDSMGCAAEIDYCKERLIPYMIKEQ